MKSLHPMRTGLFHSKEGRPVVRIAARDSLDERNGILPKPPGVGSWIDSWKEMDT